MAGLSDPYSLEQAVEAGVLVDVSDLGDELGFPCPVFMSVALRSSDLVKGKPDDLRSVIKFAKLELDQDPEKQERDKAGYITFGAYFGLRGMGRMRIYVQRTSKDELEAVVLLRITEDFDLRCLRDQATSFYTM